MRLIHLLILVFLALQFSGIASDILGWRHDGTGKFPDTQPATQWSEEENIVWKTKMPDWSNSSPIIVGHRIFVFAENQKLVCVDKNSGEILWTQAVTYADAVAKKEQTEDEKDLDASVLAQLKFLLSERQKEMNSMSKKERRAKENRKKVKQLRDDISKLNLRIGELDINAMPAKHNDNGYTSHVPVSDGQYVYAVYGTGIVAAYDLEGKRVWARLIEKPKHKWGHSTSPILADGRLVIQFSKLMALDTKTGKTLWESPAKLAWGSPVLVTINDTKLILGNGDGQVFRLEDGQQLSSKLGALQYAAPIVDGNKVYYIEGKAMASHLPEKVEGQFEANTLWTSKIKGSRHYGSALLHEGLIYAVSREGTLTVMNSETGKVVYDKDLDVTGGQTNGCYSSVTLAGNHIFIPTLSGTTIVIKPGNKYVEVARNKLEGQRSNPVFQGNKMYVRTLKHLYCIAKKDS